MGNNQNSSGQRTFKFFVLCFLSFLLMQHLLKSGSTPPPPPRTAPTLEAAFKGVDASQKPLLDKAAAQTEIDSLATQIGGLELKAQPGFWSRLFLPQQSDPKETDAYSYWARLRAGLLREYVLKDTKGATQMYDEVVNNAPGDTKEENRIKAQAIYQKGDMLWHLAKGAYGTRAEASTTLEQLVHKGRGSSAFLDMDILVPQPAPSSTKDAAQAVLNPTGFVPIRVRDLRGSATSQNLEGLPDRVDLYYSMTPFHSVFDGVVKLFGGNPGFSYGLAILFFAGVLRLALQPINKKQYASAKGMQEIAPQMKVIQAKYKDQPDKQMQAMTEIRELQKSHGVNPMSAIGWGLVQLPIFIYFVYPLIQHYEAKLELTGASFLWIHNLARPDYPLLAAYGLSQFLSFRLSATPPTDEMQAKTQGIMSIAMPLMIPLFLKDYPSAFTMFWMTFNVLSTILQYRMVKANDPNHNFVKAIMRSPFTATVEESLPSRLQLSDEKAKSKTAISSTGNAFDGKSDAPRNGKSNGKITSPDTLSKITPFDLAASNDNGGAAPRQTSNVSSNGSANGNATRTTQRKRRRRR